MARRWLAALLCSRAFFPCSCAVHGVSTPLIGPLSMPARFPTGTRPRSDCGFLLCNATSPLHLESRLALHPLGRIQCSGRFLMCVSTVFRLYSSLLSPVRPTDLLVPFSRSVLPLRCGDNNASALNSTRTFATEENTSNGPTFEANTNTHAHCRSKETRRSLPLVAVNCFNPLHVNAHLDAWRP